IATGRGVFVFFLRRFLGCLFGGRRVGAGRSTVFAAVATAASSAPATTTGATATGAAEPATASGRRWHQSGHLVLHLVHSRLDLLGLAGRELDFGRDVLPARVRDGHDPFALKRDLGDTILLALVEELRDRGLFLALKRGSGFHPRLEITPVLAWLKEAAAF